MNKTLKTSHSQNEQNDMKIIPLEDQPLSSFPWIAFGKGYNSLEEVAEAYGISFHGLKMMVERPRARFKVLTGVIQELKRKPLFYEGKFYTKKEFAELAKLPYSTVQGRWKHGWSAERIISTPVNEKPNVNIYRVHGKDYFGVQELAKAFHMNPVTVQARIAKGMTAEEAVTVPVKSKNRKFLCIGKWYSNWGEVCNEYGVPVQTFYERRKRQPKKRPDDIILELAHKPAFQYIVYEHGYNTLREIAIAHNVSFDLFYSKVNSQKFSTIEDVLEDIKNPGKYCVFGKKFKYVKDICTEYGISQYKLGNFLKKNELSFSSENIDAVNECIEKAIQEKDKKPCRWTVFGKGFYSMKEIAKEYALNEKSLDYYVSKHNGDIEAAIEDMRNPERKRKQTL